MSNQQKEDDPYVYKFFQRIDDKVGPSKEVREMLLECVLESDCMKVKGSTFKQCVQDDINKECKAIRYDLMLCRKSQVIWTKHFSKDDPR